MREFNMAEVRIEKWAANRQRSARVKIRDSLLISGFRALGWEPHKTIPEREVDAVFSADAKPGYLCVVFEGVPPGTSAFSRAPKTHRGGLSGAAHAASSRAWRLSMRASASRKVPRRLTAGDFAARRRAPRSPWTRSSPVSGADRSRAADRSYPTGATGGLDLCTRKCAQGGW